MFIANVFGKHNPYSAETKMISIDHQYRARPVCTSVLSDQALYYCLSQVNLRLGNLIGDSFQNDSWEWFGVDNTHCQ
jgi:hypothetical protein